MEAAIKTLQNSLRQKQEQIASAKNRLETLLSEEGEMILTIQNLEKLCKKETSTVSESKNTENWDLLGQDSGKFNYYVKYSAPKESNIPIESIEPKGWKSSTNPTTVLADLPKTSWADKVEEEERKNGKEKESIDQQTSQKIDSQLGGKKKAYVIFDGPMKGIYQNWETTKLHTNGKNVRYKGYETLEEAKTAYNAVYKEVATANNIVQPSKMETKKKISVDRIIYGESKFVKEVTIGDYYKNWRWLTNYSEELKTECFYPSNNGIEVKAVTVPGVGKELVRSFYDCGMIKTMYLQEDAGRKIHELELLPKDIGEIAYKFNNSFAKGKEFFLSFTSTYPWFEDDEVIKARHLIKIGISNHSYPTNDGRDVDPRPECFLHQMEKFYDTLIRFGVKLPNFRVITAKESFLVYSDSRKQAREEHLQQILKFEENFSGLEADLGRLPDPIQQECCRHFQKYKGHQCKWCAKDINNVADKESLYDSDVSPNNEENVEN